ncbi:type II toxin-antitoxin system VapC family toxin [soil metagenome]
MIVVDTNVVSELMKPAPAPAVRQWIRARGSDELFTTSITLAEIRYGIARLPDGRRKDLLGSTADQLFAAFAEQILSFDAAAAARYPAIVLGRDRAGLPIDGFDAQIASICGAHNAALATRNGKDFEQTGVRIITPW